MLKMGRICWIRQFFIEVQQNFLLFLHRGGPGSTSLWTSVLRESSGAFACIGVQTDTLNWLKPLVKYSTLCGRMRRSWSLEGGQHDCHPFPCSRGASATSLAHPVPVGRVGLPLLPQVTVLAKISDGVCLRCWQSAATHVAGCLPSEDSQISETFDG